MKHVIHNGNKSLCLKDGKLSWTESILEAEVFKDDAQATRVMRALDLPDSCYTAPRCMLKEWQCHKQVWAGRIISIDEPTILVSSYNGEPITIVPEDRWWKFNAPERGGFYVVYADGYTSYSPAKAFTEGYHEA